MKIEIDVLNGTTRRTLELSLLEGESDLAKISLRPGGPGGREIEVDVDALALAATAILQWRDACNGPSSERAAATAGAPV